MNGDRGQGATAGATNRRTLKLGCIYRNTRTGGFSWKGRPPGAEKVQYIPLRAQGKKAATRARDVAIILARRLVDRMNGVTDSAGPISRTIDAFYRQVATRSQASAKFYRSAVNRFVKHAGVITAWEITFDHVQTYLSSVAGKRAASTVHHHKVALSRFCRFCRRTGLMEHNPVADAETPRKYLPPPRYLTGEQIAVLMATAAAKAPDLVAPIRVCLGCGLRLTEMRRLRWGDINADRLTVGATDATKTYAWRVVTVPPETLAALPSPGKPEDLLFATLDKKTWIVRLKAVTVGLPVFGELPARSVGNQWHLLRSTWAVNRAREGWTPWRLMAEGGWTCLQTVLRYVNLVRASQ